MSVNWTTQIDPRLSIMNSSRSNTTVTNTDRSFQASSIEVVTVAFVIVVSLVGNHLIIFAFINNFKMRTVTNKMVVNLCVVDIMSVLIDVPFYLIPSRTNPELVQQHGFFCRFSLFMYEFMTVAATMSMFCTAVDRYLNLVHTSFRRLSFKKTKIMIGVVWCQAFLAALPWDLLSSSSKSSDLALFVCQRFPYIYSPGLSNLGLSIFLKFCCIIIPFFIIVGVFGRILHSSRTRRKIVVNDSSAISRSKTERLAVHSYARSSITAIFLFTIYLVSSTPFIFSVIYTIFIDYTNVSPSFAFTVYYFRRLKGAVLPFMYILRNRNVLVYFERKVKYWYGIGNQEYPNQTTNSLPRSRPGLGMVYRYRQSQKGERSKSTTSKNKRERQSHSMKHAERWRIFYTKQAKKELRSSFTDLSSFTDEKGYSKVVIERWNREIMVKEAGAADKTTLAEQSTKNILTTSTIGVLKLPANSEKTLPRPETSGISR